MVNSVHNECVKMRHSGTRESEGTSDQVGNKVVGSRAADFTKLVAYVKNLELGTRIV